MKFEEILPHLRRGKKIRIGGWRSTAYICYSLGYCYIIDENNQTYNLSKNDLDSNYWEVCEEKTYPVVCRRKYTLHKICSYFIYETEFSTFEEAKLNIENNHSNFEVVKLLTDL